MSGSATAPCFISLEGPEGAGKSTLAAKLKEWLQRENHSVILTREPGATELGKDIRRLLLNEGDISAETELFLFLADRSHHVKTLILPALAAGKIVLCDRYVDSTVVYQSVGRGLDPAAINQLNHLATGGLMPGLTLLLDIRPEVGLARETKGDRMDREPLEFHQAVTDGYRQLAAEYPERIQVLNAEQDVNHVFFEAQHKIRTFLALRA